jgi:hypothetical protein
MGVFTVTNEVCDSWLKSIRGKGLAVEVDGNLLPLRNHWRHAGSSGRGNTSWKLVEAILVGLSKRCGSNVRYKIRPYSLGTGRSDSEASRAASDREIQAG